VISLARLLMQMRRGARVLSRVYFLSRYGTDTNMIALGEQTWADTFAGDAGEHLDPAIPNADLDTLVTAAAAVKDFVDDHLAHRSLDAQLVRLAPNQDRATGADDSDARRSAHRHRRSRPDVPQVLRADENDGLHWPRRDGGDSTLRCKWLEVAPPGLGLLLVLMFPDRPADDHSRGYRREGVSA
jgi:hypothetical protein